MQEIRIPYSQIVDTLQSILLQYPFSRERAHLCASLFARASLEGVASHGLNRFTTFLRMIAQGHVQVAAAPALIAAFGPFERWDGQQGPGNLNAHHSMARAIALAQTHGMGCVALRNTNHWMRGGNYGWQAVEQGCIGICFSNTKPNMPAWGGSEALLGNNPLILAIPRAKGPLVLDMAMSQFSYGKMSSYLRAQKPLPYAGGFDAAGNLSQDPGTIMANDLALPIGLWKGAGLSLMLDGLAALLSDGNATYQVGALGAETALSQVFLCFDPAKLGPSDDSEEKLDALVAQLLASAHFPGQEVRYPGAQTQAVREINLKEGVPVESKIWEEILQHSP